jgi:hypothetical protein
MITDTVQQEPVPTVLESIEQLGSLQMKSTEVQLVLGIPPWEDGSPEYLAYHRGRLKAVAEVRAAVHRSALQGSSPSQKEFLELASRVASLPQPKPEPLAAPPPAPAAPQRGRAPR